MKGKRRGCGRWMFSDEKTISGKVAASCRSCRQAWAQRQPDYAAWSQGYKTTWQRRDTTGFALSGS